MVNYLHLKKIKIKNKNNVKKLIIIFLFLGVSISSFSQDKTTQYICKQIFIFGNNVTFPNQQNINKYKIAIYGRNSKVYKYMIKYYKRRKINGKPVEIKNIYRLRHLDEKFNIIYLDNSKNRLLSNVYERIHKKRELLITYKAEDTKYIMINLLGVGKKFQIQTSNLFDEKIFPNENMIAIGGTKLDLQGLYEKKVKLLSQSEKELQNKEKKLDSLSYLVNKQKLENDEKLSLINQKTLEIKEKEKRLKEQKRSLKLQNVEIKLQKNIILITIIFVIILLILSYLINRALKENKRITGQLKQRNEEINLQKDQIEEQAEEIKQQRDWAIQKGEELAEKNKDIQDSIYYALRIQQALLPSLKILISSYSEYFAFYKPRDIVSGDFYWTTEKDGKSVVVAADCTGHGVPGAFMSMLGIAFLNQIVKNLNKIETGQILILQREMIIKSLKQDIKESGSSRDGMDMSIIIYDPKTKILQYSGAYNSIYIISDEKPKIIEGFDEYRIVDTDNEKNKLYEIKADRMPIGIYYTENKDFLTKKVKLKQGDQIYMFSDGFSDLYNYAQKAKYNTKKFKQLLLSISNLPMKEQENKIESAYEDWLGEGKQIDDILVLGLKI